MYENTLPRLYETISAVCPIDGVAITDPSTTPPTVRIDYSASATQAQKDAADAALLSFDWSDQAQATWEAEKRSLVAGATNVVLTSADRPTSLDSYQDVPELLFRLAAFGSYLFRFEGTYTTSTGTRGMHLALAGPAQTFLAASYQIFVNPASFTLVTTHNYADGVHPTGSGGATELPFVVWGNLTTQAAGDFKLRYRADRTSDTVTVKRGSGGQLQALQEGP